MKDGYSLWCIDCTKENRALRKDKILEYRAKNAEKIKLQKKEWRERNLERENQRMKKYKKENKERIAKYMSKYQKENKGLVNSLASKRRASIIKQTPEWADLGYIKDLYIGCQELSEVFNRIGIKKNFHVDHIVPLKNKLVCGLHNEFNLQILLDRDNLVKSNRFVNG